MERDLQLLGATGIEDRLQDGVPDAVAALRQANLKVRCLQVLSYPSLPLSQP